MEITRYNFKKIENKSVMPIEYNNINISDFSKNVDTRNNGDEELDLDLFLDCVEENKDEIIKKLI